MREGWEVKTLEKVCERIFAGGDVPKDNLSKFKTDKYTIPIFANGEKNKGLYGYTDISKVVEPSITVSARGTIGYSEIRNEPFFPIVRLIVLIPNKEIIDLNFLKYVISSMEFKKSGTSIPQLTVPMIKKYEANIPPLPEQTQIVKTLDSAFAQIDQAKANLEKNLANAKELFQSKLNEVFSQRGEGWVEKRLGDESLLQIIDGDRGKNYPKKSDFFSEGHCVFLNTKNVRPNGFSMNNLMFITEERDNLLRKGKLERDDIVMTTRGTIGNLGWYSKNIKYDNIRINSGMLIFRVNKEKILPQFLFKLFQSPFMKKQILDKTTGAAQPQLPIKTLVNFILPLNFDLNKQNEMIGKIEELEHLQERLVYIYQQKLNNLEELKKSILEKAFRGEMN